MDLWITVMLDKYGSSKDLDGSFINGLADLMRLTNGRLVSKKRVGSED